MNHAEAVAAQRRRVEDRRGRVLDFVRRSDRTVGTMDVARGLRVPPDLARGDLAELERRGVVERYGSEFGNGWLWLAR